MPGGVWSHDFGARIPGWRAMDHNMARVCESATVKTYSSPTLGGKPTSTSRGLYALIPAYLQAMHTKKEIGEQVSEIRAHIKGYPGDKLRDQELKEWLREIEKVGLRMPRVACENPTVIQGYRLWIGVDYSGYVTRNTVTLYVRGSKDTGYKFQVNQVSGSVLQ